MHRAAAKKPQQKKAQPKVKKPVVAQKKRAIATKKVVTVPTIKQQTPFVTTFQRRFNSAKVGETLYSKDHEYLKFDSATTAHVGISHHAQELLGDIVYVDLPAIGAMAKAGERFAAVESVKASNDVFAPASLKVLKVNPALDGEPQLVNTDAEGEGWFAHVEVTDSGDFGALMNKEQYVKYLETCDH